MRIRRLTAEDDAGVGNGENCCGVAEICLLVSELFSHPPNPGSKATHNHLTRSYAPFEDADVAERARRTM